MDLHEYLRIVRRGWAVILTCVILGVGIGLAVALATTKIYRANAQLFVATDEGGLAQTPGGLAQGNNFVEDRVQSYTTLATSPKVTKPVISDLRLQLKPQQLAAKIEADAPPNKVLINLHVTDQSPRVAARLANAIADRFATFVEQTEHTGSSGKSVVSLTVVHPATIPDTPIKPNKKLDIGLGFAVGLLAGLAFVIIRDLVDTSVTASDFDEIGVPVLGLIPWDKRTPGAPIAFREEPNGARAEAYRLLRTNLQFVNVDNAPRVIAITSAIAGEGKSTSALNLAAALAEAGSRVCLVDADLRRPTIASSLGLVPDVGLTTVLIGKARLRDVLQNAGRNLAVLTSGPMPPNPSELLVSEHTRALIREIAALVDYTIIDSAPLLPVADGAEVAALADATLVVHRAGKTSKEQAIRSVGALKRVGKRPVGVILNMVTRRSGRYEYDDNYYYTYRPRREARPVPELFEPAAAASAAEQPDPVESAAAEPTSAGSAEPAPNGRPPETAPAGENEVEPDHGLAFIGGSHPEPPPAGRSRKRTRRHRAD